MLSPGLEYPMKEDSISIGIAIFCLFGVPNPRLPRRTLFPAPPPYPIPAHPPFSPSGTFREEVVVPDGKNKERDLRFCPNRGSAPFTPPSHLRLPCCACDAGAIPVAWSVFDRWKVTVHRSGKPPIKSSAHRYNRSV